VISRTHKPLRSASTIVRFSDDGWLFVFVVVILFVFFVLVFIVVRVLRRRAQPSGNVSRDTGAHHLGVSLDVLGPI
jgi:heme/copper-type cytochrome/quinol oxidase subunit 2